MVTLTSAQDALKTVYLGVVSDQLNISANPLLSKINQTTRDVWGKEVRKLAPYGINGGIGAGTEEGSLPNPASNNYVQFVTTLKNLYGTIEISDKAIRASQHNAGAFVNLLNDEMEGLIKASSFNLGRMLYGDGSGKLATVVQASTQDTLAEVDSVRNLIEGMVVDFYNDQAVIEGLKGVRIIAIDRQNSQIKLNTTVTIPQGAVMYVQGSKDQEITGLGAIFKTSGTLYGVDKSQYTWMNPYVKAETSIGDETLQVAVDTLEETTGSMVDFIVCSSKVKRLYQKYLQSYRRNIDIMELNGGYKAISFNGIPLISDRFIEDDTMYLLNTKEFNLHQLCDWKWLEGEDGKIIKQNAGFPTYSATLVKYADLVCNKPNGQAKISGITSASV